MYKYSGRHPDHLQAGQTPKLCRCAAAAATMKGCTTSTAQAFSLFQLVCLLFKALLIYSAAFGWVLKLLNAP